MNGTPPVQADSLAGTVLRFVSALVIIGALLVWLYFGLLHPETHYLTESAEGIIVGGFISIITLIVNSLFQGEATRAASRASAQATQAGVSAAMTPVAVATTTTTTPEATTTTTGPPAGQPERPCAICGITEGLHGSITDHPFS